MNENNSRLNSNLFHRAKQCLDCGSLEEKLSMTKATAAAWRNGELEFGEYDKPQPVIDAGRPEKPSLVNPKDLAKRSFHTPEGKAAMFHAIAHIEFNAINLGWDAVYRFRDMPRQYYSDWIQVADEEAYHFELIRGYLNEKGYDYGDFDAHRGLWDMAVDTDFDVMVRMALVPRVLEARGLDVTPGMMERLKRVSDNEAVSILEIIYRDEIGHVEIGTRWFHHCCKLRGLEPEATFFELINKYMKGGLKGPFNLEARVKAGFSERELKRLEGES